MAEQFGPELLAKMRFFLGDVRDPFVFDKFCKDVVLQAGGLGDDRLGFGKTPSIVYNNLLGSFGRKHNLRADKCNLTTDKGVCKRITRSPGVVHMPHCEPAKTG